MNTDPGIEYTAGELSKETLRDTESNPSLCLALLKDQVDRVTNFCEEGFELLSKEEALSYEEFHRLLEMVVNINVVFPHHRLVQTSFYWVVKKGIDSLAIAVDQNEDLANEAETKGSWLRNWFAGIVSQLQPGRRLGIGSHSIKAEKSRELIESLIPIVQRMRSHTALNALAVCRFPGDNSAMALFYNENKNW